MPAPKYFAVVPAAGVGQRMGADVPKQYLAIAGKTILEHSLQALLLVPGLEKLVVALDSSDKRWQTLEVFDDPRIECVDGGRERSHSVLNALEHLQAQAADDDWVLVHDAARPCIQLADIQRLLKALAGSGSGGVLGVPVIDTVKQVDKQHRVTGTLDRNQLWLAQTPQMFRYAELRQALREGIKQGLPITDEASAIELAGGSVKIIEGSSRNIKVTRQEDLALAAFYLNPLPGGSEVCE